MIAKKYGNVIVWGFITLVAYSLKLQALIGTQSSFFSGFNIVGPLAGFYLGAPMALLLFVMRSLFFKSVLGAVGSLILSLHIPTLCASAYLRYSSGMIRIGIPALCIFFFLAHPVGAQAWFYSLYWFIPMALYYSRADSFFVQALGSTFTAHAVGSVLWLYIMPFEPTVFAHLMPLVLIERFMYASGMTFVYYVALYSKQLILSPLRITVLKQA